MRRAHGVRPSSAGDHHFWSGAAASRPRREGCRAITMRVEIRERLRVEIIRLPIISFGGRVLTAGHVFFDGSHARSTANASRNYAKSDNERQAKWLFHAQMIKSAEK
jgi:hypothetical protein